MGRPQERDWKTIYEIWQATGANRRNGKPIPLKRFCQAQNLPYSSTRYAFSELENSGSAKKNENAKNSHIAEKTPNTARGAKKNAKKARGCENGAKTPGKSAKTHPPPALASPDGRPDFSVLLEANQILVDQLTTCRDALTSIAQWSRDYQTDGAEPRNIRMVTSTLKDTVDTLKSLTPTISEAEANAYRTWILNQCLRGEFSAEQAALHFELIGVKIPEAVEIVLRRTPVPEPVPAEDDIPDDAELDAVYEESVKKIKAQKETWLPDRRDDISDLKEEMAVEAGEGYVRADDDGGDDGS